MSTKSTTETTYFVNLDSLRFLAFLGVFFSHTIVYKIDNAIIDSVVAFLGLNYLSVPFFFSLSSFLITYNLLKEKKTFGKIRLLNFYRNRALRIWPIYFLLILIAFVAIPFFCKLVHINPPTLPSIYPFLFFYVNFHIIENGLYFTFILSILWSISIEEQFYIFWGALLKLVNPDHLFYAIAILFGISITYSYFNRTHEYLVINTLYVLQNFCLGAVIAWICVCEKKLLQKLQNIPSKYFLIPYIILPLSYMYIDDVILKNIVKSICYGLIIFDQTFNVNRLFNTGKSRLINYFGKISYGLYVYHALVMDTLRKKFNFFGPEATTSATTNLLHILIAFSITAIIAHFSYRFIEQKFLAMKVKTVLS